MLSRARADVVLPYKLARQAAGWRGRIPLESFARFGALVTPLAPAVDVELDFRLDDDGRCRLAGRAVTRVGVECGRCLQPQARDLEVALELCIVATDADAAALEPQLEPYVLDGEEALVVDLVEDDLILALPGRVCEEPETCPNGPVLDYPETGSQADSEVRKSPFSALAGLVGKRS